MCLCTTVKQPTLAQTHLAILKVTSRSWEGDPKTAGERATARTVEWGKEKRQLFLTSQVQNGLQRTASPIVLEWNTREIMFYFDCLPACKTQHHHADGSTHANWSDDTALYSLSPRWRTHAASKQSRNSAPVPLQINVLPPFSPYGA